MTQAPQPTLSKRPATVVSMHRTGDSCRFVVATAPGTGQPLRVTESGVISVSDPKAVETLLSKAANGGMVVQVVPPEATILRSAPPKLVLDGTPEQVQSALALVAEGELPGTVAPHRRAAGVFRAGHAHAVYAVGWIGPEGTILPGATPIPAVAALAALHRATAAPDGTALFADNATGTATLVSAGKGESPRLLIRVLRDDPSDRAAFQAVIAEALDDASADLEIGKPTPICGTLYLPARLNASIGMANDDKIGEFALCLGAAMFALSLKPDEQPLLTMTDRSPLAGRTIATRVRDGLGTPKAAVVTVAICAVAMLGGWIAAAPIKLALLKSRVGEDTGDYAKAIQQHDWYKSLREKRWPMTALIAELVSGAPSGIRIESLAIEQGRSVNIAGTAESAASVERWCNSLRGKVFTGVMPSVPDESASVVRFTIKADVSDAMLAAVSEIRPIASTETGRTRSDPAAAPSRNDRSTSRTTPAPAGRSGAAGTATPAAATLGELSQPMTDAQIDRLSSGLATIEWAKRKRDLTRTDIDDATRKRLEQELTRIEARRKALGGGQ